MYKFSLVLFYSFLFFILTVVKLTAQNCPPAALYHFTHNAADSSGNGLIDTVHNATLIADRFGEPNLAYSFNGTNSYISLGDNPILKRYATDFTISAWVYLHNYSTTYGSGVVSNRGENSIGSGLIISGPSALAGQGRVCLTVGGGATASDVVSNTILSLNTWYYIAATFKYYGNNMDSVHIFVNGILDNKGVVGDVLDPLATSTYVGFEPSPLAPETYHFDGIIDEVAIYNCVLPDTIIFQRGQPVYYLPLNTKPTLTVSKELVVYPNPSSGIFDVKNCSPFATYRVYSVTGTEVAYGMIGSSIDLPSLTKGLYELVVIDQDQSVRVTKLLIE